MDYLKRQQLVVICKKSYFEMERFEKTINFTLLNSATKVQTGISKTEQKIRKSVDIFETHTPFVHNFGIFPFKERTHLRLAGQNCGDELAGDFLLQFIVMRHIPLLETKLSLPRKQKHEVHLESGKS